MCTLLVYTCFNCYDVVYLFTYTYIHVVTWAFIEYCMNEIDTHVAYIYTYSMLCTCVHIRSIYIRSIYIRSIYIRSIYIRSIYIRSIYVPCFGNVKIKMNITYIYIHMYIRMYVHMYVRTY